MCVLQTLDGEYHRRFLFVHVREASITSISIRLSLSHACFFISICNTRGLLVSFMMYAEWEPHTVSCTPCFSRRIQQQSGLRFGAILLFGTSFAADCTIDISGVHSHRCDALDTFTCANAKVLGKVRTKPNTLCHSGS